MKTPLTWTKNLYEIGAPIRSAVERIQTQQAQAEAALRDAKKKHRETMKQLRWDAVTLEGHIATLWSAQEIDAAKRGFILIDGKEIRQ